MSITILGTGHYVPGTPITNDQLSRVMDTSDEWIRPRTGIGQRHYAADGEGVSDMAVIAAKRALENAGVQASEVDFIIFATMTPEYMFPGSGALLGSKLGIPGVAALDIRQQCAAMPYGLQIAAGMAAAGEAKTILLIGSDTHAGFMPWVDWDVLYGRSDKVVAPEDYERATRHRGVAVLFGDGAAAMVLREVPGQVGFLGADLHADGRYFDRIYLPGGGFRTRPYINQDTIALEEYVPRMQGRDLMKIAVHELAKSVHSVCDKAGVKTTDIDVFVAHQANDRINAAVRQALGAEESKVPSNIERYGNTSAATIGILLDELRHDGRVKKGDLVCLFGLGSGLNWGSALVRM